MFPANPGVSWCWKRCWTFLAAWSLPLCTAYMRAYVCVRAFVVACWEQCACAVGMMIDGQLIVLLLERFDFGSVSASGVQAPQCGSLVFTFLPGSFGNDLMS